MSKIMSVSIENDVYVVIYKTGTTRKYAGNKIPKTVLTWLENQQHNQKNQELEKQEIAIINNNIPAVSIPAIPAVSVNHGGFIYDAITGVLPIVALCLFIVSRGILYLASICYKIEIFAEFLTKSISGWKIKLYRARQTVIYLGYVYIPAIKYCWNESVKFRQEICAENRCGEYAA